MSLKNEPQSAKKLLDYRFSLANERTFLSWIRTSLALLAGSVAIDQFITSTHFPVMRLFLATLLAFIGAFLAVNAFFRWRANEKAMQEDRPLPYNHLLSIISILVLIAAICFVILFWVGN